MSAALFAGVFVLFVWKIARRYLWGDPAAAADELSVVLFVWIVFWANAFVVPERQQIAFDLLYRHLPPAGQRAAKLLRLAVVGGVFLWALPAVVDYLRFLWRERTPVLQWRLDLVYSCFGLFAAAVVLRAAWGIAGQLRPGWRDRL